MNKRAVSIMILLQVLLSIATIGCGKNNAKDKELMLYNALLQKVISGEEMFSDEGEGYTYNEAEEPGYALYDIDKDGKNELFITPRMSAQWHTYSVYYIQDSEVLRLRAFNGYLPDRKYWTYSFDFFIDAYEFSSTNELVHVWEFDYPLVDGIEANTLIYEGKDPEEISDDELDKLLAGHITEPADLKWNLLTTDTDITIR